MSEDRADIEIQWSTSGCVYKYEEWICKSELHNTVYMHIMNSKGFSAAIDIAVIALSILGTL